MLYRISSKKYRFQPSPTKKACLGIFIWELVQICQYLLYSLCAVFSTDQTNYTVAPQTTQNKCVTNENAWLKLLSDQNIAGERNDIPSVASTRVFANIHDALQWISQGRDPLFGMAANDSGKVPETLVKCRHLQVLCVGSLHLIGGVLGLLQPDMNSSNMLL